MTSEPPAKLEPLGGVRIFFAVVGILIMALTGGCSLFFLFAGGVPDMGSLLIILLVGGLPFLVGYTIWRLAVRSGRRQIPQKP